MRTLNDILKERGYKEIRDDDPDVRVFFELPHTKVSREKHEIDRFNPEYYSRVPKIPAALQACADEGFEPVPAPELVDAMLASPAGAHCLPGSYFTSSMVASGYLQGRLDSQGVELKRSSKQTPVLVFAHGDHPLRYAESTDSTGMVRGGAVLPKGEFNRLGEASAGNIIVKKHGKRLSVCESVSLDEATRHEHILAALGGGDYAGSLISRCQAGGISQVHISCDEMIVDVPRVYLLNVGMNRMEKKLSIYCSLNIDSFGRFIGIRRG